MRLIAFIPLTGLILTGYYFYTPTAIPGIELIFTFLYFANIFSGKVLAKILNRSMPGWIALSVLVPFVSPVILAFLSRRPDGTLTDADAAWGRMDWSTNPMTICAVLMFDEPLDYDKFQELVKDRLLCFDRFRQLVGNRKASPVWQDDPNFDFEYHMQRVTLPGKGDQPELQKLASELLSSQLDFSKPLWQIHFIEKYEKGSAFVVRIHHCIADGMALVRVLLSLTDEKADAVWTTEQQREMKKIKTDEEELVTTSVRDQLTSGPSLLKKTLEVITSPPKLLKAILACGNFLMSLGKLLILGPDSRTILKGKLDGKKRVAWSNPISLQEIKEVGYKMEGKVNDVLVTALSGAIQSYLKEHGGLRKRANIRLIIPVNLRPAKEDLKLGNHFGTVFLSLPLGIEDPVERLAEVRKRMGNIKASYEALASFGILNVIGMFPLFMQKIIVYIFTLKATGGMSNVPGPKETIYLAGSPLKHIMFWVPVAGLLGLGVSIISYDGEVMLGVATDTAIVKDPEIITQNFQKEVEILLQLAKSDQTVSIETVESPTPNSKKKAS